MRNFENLQKLKEQKIKNPKSNPENNNKIDFLEFDLIKKS